MPQSSPPTLLPSPKLRAELDRFVRQRPEILDFFVGPSDSGAVRPVTLGQDPTPYPAVHIPIPERPGVLLVGRMPGWPEPEHMPGELRAIRAAGVDRVICFVPRRDLPSLYHLPDYATECARLFGEGHRFVEVMDYEAPGRVSEFTRSIAEVDRWLQEGRKILLHCGAGCGRTGMFVACLFCRLGMDPIEAIRLYRRRRGCGPETPEQEAFVLYYHQALAQEPLVEYLEDP